MRFGLIGTGVIGTLRARALQQLPDTTVAAVFDVDADRAAALAAETGADAYTDLDALWRRDDLDAVVVASPPQFHEAQVLEALDAGLHVLCEKPLSNSVAACRRLVETARARGLTLTTGFNHRYFPAIQFVRETLDAGVIGRVDHVRAFAGHVGLSEFRAAWERDPDVLGGGALMDVGIHLIDLTHYLLGDVAEVYGVATSNVWDLGRAEDNGIAVLRSGAGVPAVLQATWSEWKGYRFHVDVYGTHGMVRAYYAPMFGMLVQMDEPGGARKRSFNLYPKTMLMEKLHSWTWTVDRTFQQELRDFVRLVGGTRGTLADGFDGQRAVEIAHAVYTSSDERRPVTLAPRPDAVPA